MTIRSVFSTLRMCIPANLSASSAAGVQAAMEGTISVARLGLDLQSNGKVLKMGWRTEGSLRVRPAYA